MCIKMSDVRLSNASPTLERVDARLPDNLRLPVCRNLFGRPDPGEIQRNAAAVVREDVQAFTEKYNFDPVEERPLASGAFEWEEDRNAPDFYLLPPHGTQRPRGEGEPQRPLEFHLQPPHGIQRPRGEEEPQRPLGGSQPRLAGSDNQADTQAAPVRSRKRRSGDLGPCSSECQGKRSHTDEDDDDDDDVDDDDDDDDDEDPSNGAVRQVVLEESGRPNRPESGAEVQ